MGISYDPPSKKWNVSYEKVDIKQIIPPILPDLSVNNIKPATFQWKK
jgi:hypothetical protein